MSARLLFVSMSLVAVSAVAEPTRTYVVKEGDTCVGIAVRELGDRAKLDELHRLNRWLGPLPHRLQAGQKLALPAAPTAPDAKLSFQRGDVEVRRAGEAAWLRTETGSDLFRAWRVGAREHGAAQVTFADQSTIGMRENTVVVIYGATRTAAVTDAHISLERGALRARIEGLDGRRTTLETPAGLVALGIGSAVVDVDATRTTRVSNHTGKEAVLSSRTRARRKVRIAAGYGSQVAPGAEPSPARPLPRAPAIQPRGTLALGWPGRPGVVQAAWAPATNVARYRVELARDAELGAVELRLDAPGTASALELREVPAGEYWLSVIAVDDAGFESAPAAPVPVRVVDVALPPDARIDADGVLLLTPGSELPRAGDLACTLDGEPHRVADAPGPHRFACASPTGMVSEVEVRVAAVDPVPPTPPPVPRASTPDVVATHALSPRAEQRRIGVAMTIGGGNPDRRPGELARAAVGLGARLYRGLHGDLSLSRLVFARDPVLVRVGGSVHLGLGLAEVSGRAGALIFSDGDHPGAYLGAGLAGHVSDRIDVIAIGDVLEDRRGPSVEITAGLQVWLW